MERSLRARLISRKKPSRRKHASLWRLPPAQAWAWAAVHPLVRAPQATAPARIRRVPFWIANKVELRERELLRQQFNAMVPWSRQLSAQAARGRQICATDQAHLHWTGRIHAQPEQHGREENLRS